MDEWSFLDECDVLSKWSSEHKKIVFDGGKWSERKEGLEALNTLMINNPRLSTDSMEDYSQLVGELRKILDRESNIVVVSTAARTVELLARGLRAKFGAYVGMVLPFLIKRSKDKKKNVRDAVSTSIDAVASSTSAEKIQKEIVEWFSVPSPESKQTALEFLYRYFINMSVLDIPFIKAVAPLTVKCASESDVGVREKAYMAIGSIRRLLGEAGSAPFLGPLAGDTAKMDKIAQFEKQAIEEWTKLNAEKAKSQVADGPASGDDTENGVSEVAETSAGAAAVLDPWTMMDPVDVGNKLDKDVETLLTSNAWKERVEGCEKLKKAVDEAGRIDIGERLREICIILIKIIGKDVNVNVSSLSATVLTGIAKKARFAYAPIANKSFSIVFDKLKDKKAVLRDALNELVDASATTTPMNVYAEAIIDALASKNPQTRAQTAAFLARHLGKQGTTTADIAAIKVISDSVTKAANDADKEVRQFALSTVAAVAKCCGVNVAQRMFAEVFEDKLKAEKIPSLVEEIEKENVNMPSEEMKRLANEYGVGKGEAITGAPKQSSNSAPVKKRIPSAPAQRPAPVRVASAASSRPTPQAPIPRAAQPKPLPSVAVRPTSSSSTVRSRPAAPAVNGFKPVIRSSSAALPRVASIGAVNRMSSAAPVAPKPFKARPAPSFGTSGAPRVQTSVVKLSSTTRHTPVVAVGRAVSATAKPRMTPSTTPAYVPPKAVGSRINASGTSVASITARRNAPPNSEQTGIPRPSSMSRTSSQSRMPSNGLSGIRPPSPSLGRL